MPALKRRPAGRAITGVNVTAKPWGLRHQIGSSGISAMGFEASWVGFEDSEPLQRRKPGRHRSFTKQTPQAEMAE